VVKLKFCIFLFIGAFEKKVGRSQEFACMRCRFLKYRAKTTSGEGQTAPPHALKG